MDCGCLSQRKQDILLSMLPQKLLAEMSRSRLGVVGWREEVVLRAPRGTKSLLVQAKMDTGALTCALHAEEMKIFERPSGSWIEFKIYADPKKRRRSLKLTLPLLDMRRIRSSDGVASMRPVVKLHLDFAGLAFETEVTLVDRSIMGFPMLIGRRALRGRFWVNPSKSYLHGKRK